MSKRGRASIAECEEALLVCELFPLMFLTALDSSKVTHTFSPLSITESLHLHLQTLMVIIQRFPFFWCLYDTETDLMFFCLQCCTQESITCLNQTVKMKTSYSLKI